MRLLRRAFEWVFVDGRGRLHWITYLLFWTIMTIDLSIVALFGRPFWAQAICAGLAVGCSQCARRCARRVSTTAHW